MNKSLISKLEFEIIIIGNKIKLWREDNKFRNILDSKLFKTQADNNANKFLYKTLNKLYPDITILSEEDKFFNDIRPDKYWLLDPIDGTASWYDGYDGFVTQLAYIENNETLYSAVYSPVMDKFWTAIKDEGAYLNGKKLPKLKFLDRLNLVDNYPSPKRVAKYVYDNFDVTKYIECGSLGLKSCLVADGTADLFVKDITFRDWDIAPALAFLPFLNGRIADLDNNDIVLGCSIEFNKGLIVSHENEIINKTFSCFKR